jgi:hypothetical protein
MFVLQVAAVLFLTAFFYWAAWVWPTLSSGFWSAVFGGIGFMLPIASLAAVAGVLLAPGINFDQLMYFPNQQYPEFGHGGRIERIGAWAYVHE